MSFPLHDAVMNNQADLVNLLLLNGVDVNCKDESQQTPLHCASQLNGGAEVVEFLLSNGVDPHAKNSKGKTPLHISACSRNTAVVEVLLKYGACVDAKDDSQKTPLDRAIEFYGAVNTVKALVNGGASVDTRDDSHRTLLHRAIDFSATIETVGALLDSGVDILAKNHEGQTALHLAVSKTNLDMVKLLVQHRRCKLINVKDGHQRTPLHYAVINGAVNITELLLKKSADKDAKDFRKETPLHLAVRKHSLINIQIVRLLIQHGASVNSKDENKRTPLHCVESLQIFKILFEAGAHSNCKDREGNRPIHKFCQLAVSFDENKRPTASVDILHTLIDKLLAAGARFNARNYRGKSALHYAHSSTSLKSIIEYLVRRPNVPGIRKQLVIDYCTWRMKDDDPWVHLIKLKAAKLLCNTAQKVTIVDDGDKKFHKYCLKEVRKLKNIFIDDGNTSLLDFLKMPLRIRVDKVSSKKLRELVESPQFDREFLVYSSIIVSNYHEALRLR